MIIDTPAAEGLTGHAADMYRTDLDGDGFVFGYTQAMAVNPEAHQAFEALIRAAVPSIGVRLYELVTLAAARAIGSPHCLLAHGRKALRAEAIDETRLTALMRRDDDASGLTPAEAAAVAYAERLSREPTAMTDADTRVLRDRGYTDRQIVDITIAAAARNFFSRALLALAVPVDDVPGLSPELRETLLASISDERSRADARATISGG